MFNTHFGLAGTAKISVVEGGRVVREYPPVRNLILNQGLDAIGTYILRDCWQFAAAGTGSTVTEQVSGADTATIVAGAVTVSNPGFLNGDSSDVGRTFKLASGNIYTITAAGNTTTCTVSPLNSEGPSTFTIYNTNQLGLTSESTGGGGSTKRTNTLLTGAPFTQTVTSGATTRMTRTFDFAAEAAPITYNEVGFARVNTVGSNLFSRIKLPSGVPLTVGQQLRVEYSVYATVGASTPVTFGVSPVSGWPTATGTLQHISIPFVGINTSGGPITGVNSIDNYYYGGGEPATTANAAVSTDFAAHPSYGAQLSRTDPLGCNGSLSYSSYVAGSYTRDHFITFPVGSANSTLIRSFETNYYVGFYTVATRFLFDTNQTKLSTHTLTMGFRYTWGRVL